ncbi:MAG: lipopolysaccharide heptosyltransferase II [Planctomycetota bacterium]
MKLAIMLPNWVGDACMATPALRSLHNEQPNLKEFCWIGRPAPLMVLQGLDWATSTICYKPRSKQPSMLNRRKLVAEMRKRRFDAILLFTNSLSTAFIARLAGIPRRIGFARDGRSWLLTDPVPTSNGLFNAYRDPCIVNYLRLANHLGCTSQDRSTHLVTTEDDRDLASKLWQELDFHPSRPTVLLNAGAATAETKRWPMHHAAAAARTLAQQHGFQVLIHCGPAEKEMANNIESHAQHPSVRSMGHWKDLPLGLSKGVIERSQLVISTDSGPRHIAIALNKPVVSIFGSIDPSMTRSFNLPESIVSMGLPCQPCGKYKCPLKHTRCMNDLDAPRVVRATLQAFDALQRQAG